MPHFLSLYRFKYLVIVMFIALLTACGSGGKVTDPPEKPTPKISPKSEEVVIEWDNVEGAFFYNVYWDDKPGVTTKSPHTVKAETNTISIDGLANDTTYYFIVTAVGEGNESRASTELTATPIAPKVATGSSHTCVIKSDRSLWCWGSNDKGELGDGSYETRLSPVRIGVDNDWTDIGLGSNFTCASKLDGTLWCWGDKSSDQLGIVSTEDIIVPTKVDIDHKVSTLGITFQSQSTCELSPEGLLHCWGYNWFGQAGVGNVDFSVPPSQIGETDKWSFVAIGGLHTCAIKDDGTLWCWGANFLGQLGDGSYQDSTSPTRIGELDNWSIATVGTSSSCAIDDNNELWCWGGNFTGQLGDGTYESQLTPFAIAADKTWSTIAIGGSFSCAINTDGSLWCWGDNDQGRLGNGTQESSPEPVQVGTATDWVSVAASDAFACAITASGNTYCWGNGEYGQLGINDTNIIDIDGDTPWVLSPTLVEYPSN